MGAVVDINYNSDANTYVAFFSCGSTVKLAATNYTDAVCEADQLVEQNG